MRSSARWLLPFVLALSVAGVAQAHAVGGDAAGEVRRFALPPWVVWITGGAVVGLSFLLMAAFLTRPHEQRAAREPVEAAPGNPHPFQAIGLGLLLVALLPALPPFQESLLPHALLWLVAWGLLPLAAYTLGDPWRRANPFLPLGRLADRLRGSRAPLRYPGWLGAWPAVLVLVAITGLEIRGRGLLEPSELAQVLAAYVAITFLGMLAFGAHAWLARAEAFTRLCRVLAHAAPLARRGDGRLRWRAPWHGVRSLDARESGAVAFVIAILYGANFDGFVATPPGRALLALLDARIGSDLAHVALLLGGYAAFLLLYAWCAGAIRRKAEATERATDMAVLFAGALLPIAIAYHAAHNLVYLLQNSPLLAHALVDPLGLGWTAGAWPLALSLPAWVLTGESVLQLALILLGHIVAVAAAHECAQDGFDHRVQAFRSELPLTYVMIAYTLVGLWIVSLAAHGAGGIP